MSGSGGLFRVEANEVAGWLVVCRCCCVVVTLVVVSCMCRDTLKNPTCIHSKRPRVYQSQVHMFQTYGRAIGTHGHVSNVHTETRSMHTFLAPFPHHTHTHSPTASHNSRTQHSERQQIQVHGTLAQSQETTQQINNEHTKRETTSDTRDNATKKLQTCDQSHTQGKTR